MIRRPLRLLLRPLLLLLALLWAPFAVLAAVNLDDTWHAFPSLLAFLPYAVVGTLLVAVLCLVIKARVVALVAIAGLAVLVVPRLGRVTADAQPPAIGTRIVVATSNDRLGLANARALVTLVQREHVDILAVQEDTPEFTARLAAAGLRNRLSYAVLRPGDGARGISLYSRWPVTRVSPRPGDRRSVGGLIQLPTSQRIAVRSVHPAPPFDNTKMHRWNANTRGLLATTRATPVPTILAGDFNATLDHHSLRHVIAAGRYRDAAEQTGLAWRPTWSNGRWATLTLDHILVPPRIAIEDLSIHDLADTDHDVLVGTLRLPA